MDYLQSVIEAVRSPRLKAEPFAFGLRSASGIDFHITVGPLSGDLCPVSVADNDATPEDLAELYELLDLILGGAPIFRAENEAQLRAGMERLQHATRN